MWLGYSHQNNKFSQSDPLLIRQFSKESQSDPVLIWPKLASVLIQSDPVLIRAHLCLVDTKRREESFVGKYFPISRRPFPPAIRVARMILGSNRKKDVYHLCWVYIC